MSDQTAMWGRTVAAAALEWVGTPYRHQGSCKGVGCDCLGLVRGVWRALYGREPEPPVHYSRDWAEAGGEELLLEAVRRHFFTCPDGKTDTGRLIVFRWRPDVPAKHAGICIDGERFVHAYEGTAVTVSRLVPQWRRRIAGVFAFPERVGA